MRMFFASVRVRRCRCPDRGSGNTCRADARARTLPNQESIILRKPNCWSKLPKAGTIQIKTISNPGTDGATGGSCA